MTEEEKLAFWSKFHQQQREKRARELALYGHGYKQRRQRNWDIITGKPLLRAASKIGELFNALSEKFGGKVVEQDRTTEPTFKLNLKDLLAQDTAQQTAPDQFFAELNSALGSQYEGETFDAPHSTTALAQAASTALTAAPKIIALTLDNGASASIEGFGSIEEILAKIEYGFPENELPELLNLLRPQRAGIEEVSDVFARHLFYRAVVQLANRTLDPETAGGVEAERLQYFALGIKGLRPDIDQNETFNEITRVLHTHLQSTQYPNLTESNIISIFDRVREPHVKEALHNATDAPSVVPDDSVAPLAGELGSKEALSALAEGLGQLPESEGGTPKVVPIRPATPKPEPEDPSSNP